MPELCGEASGVCCFLLPILYIFSLPQQKFVGCSSAYLPLHFSLPSLRAACCPVHYGVVIIYLKFVLPHYEILRPGIKLNFPLSPSSWPRANHRACVLQTSLSWLLYGSLEVSRVSASGCRTIWAGGQSTGGEKGL